jgi:hypothetical protein
MISPSSNTALIQSSGLSRTALDNLIDGTRLMPASASDAGDCIPSTFGSVNSL